MKFTIERDLWFRGCGPYGSQLLRIDGTMCCIGFVGRTCGATDTQLDRAYASHRQEFWPKWFFNETGTNKPDLVKIYNVNDDETISEKKRESKLKAIFKRNGDEIVFVGKP